MTGIPDNILRRITALRAMSMDKSSENEAMVAAAQLHKLLIKYQISIDEIEQEVQEFGRSEVVVKKQDFGAWSRIIGSSLCDLYFCRFYYESNREFQLFSVVGGRHHRSTAIHMMNGVIRAVDRAARIGVTTSPENPWAYICAFRVAAAMRISKRVKLMIEQARAGELDDGDGGKFPVLASMYDTQAAGADEVIARLGLDLKMKKNSSKATSDSGARAGRDFGEKVQLNQGISNSVPKQLPGGGK